MNRPNILHVFTDQQRFDTIAALGNGIIKTPNLDRLCREGVAFTNAYTPSPVCVSARCSMIMGQYPMNTNCYANTPMPQDRQTFMDALTEAGYRTHGIGKCHFSPDRYALRGFGSREHQEEGPNPRDIHEQTYYRYLYDKGLTFANEVMGVRGEMYYVPQKSAMPAAEHPTQWVGDRAVAFVEDAATGEPWHLLASFIHPHPPFAPPDPWHKLYRTTLMPLPKVPPDWGELLTHINRVQNRYKYRDQGIDRNLVRVMKAYYYACISFVDYQVGRLLDALERTGQLDNTLILFTSDHGEHLGDYNCFGKRSFHDTAARIPMIVRGPGGFDGGQISDEVVSLVDVAPTFLSAAEARITDHPLDGLDLADVLAGRTDREIVFGQFAQEDRSAPDFVSTGETVAAGSSYMAVSKRWKYFYSAPDDREFLFDRKGDPGETRNQAYVTQFRGEACDHMRSALLAYLGQCGTREGVEGDQWRTFPKRKVPSDPDAGLLIQDTYTPWANMTFPPGYDD